MENIVTTQNLCFDYTDEETSTVTNVLKNISVDIKKGEFVAVLGHNGSGKSTFAKHLNAILLPASGKVFVEGIDTSDEKRFYEIRKKVGMVFQNPDNQMVANIIEDDVAFAPENLGLPREEIRKRVDASLEAVNMSEFAMHAPHMLSGGQKQRIAIAGVLAMEPDLLVLDEPTAMLDPNGRREVIDTVRRLNREQNITVVLITHYMDEAVLADRVIVIDKGEIRIDDTPDNVFCQVERLKSLGLDVPQSTEVAHLLNNAGLDIDKHVLNVDDCSESILKLWKSQGE